MVSNKPNDQIVIEAVLGGDHEQFRYLVEQYHRGLLQHLYNLTRDEQSAEDVAQEAFIRAFNKLELYNSKYAFSTWLYKIADNIAYRDIKKSKSMLDIDDIESALPDDKPPIPEIVDKQLDKEAVRGAIVKLPSAYQQVVALYYWEGCSYQEIALIIERPINTVRTWLYRAKEQLREELYGQV